MNYSIVSNSCIKIKVGLLKEKKILKTIKPQNINLILKTIFFPLLRERVYIYTFPTATKHHKVRRSVFSNTVTVVTVGVYILI